MKVAKIPEIVKNINNYVFILNDLKNNFNFEKSTFKEIEKIHKIQNELEIEKQYLYEKLSFKVPTDIIISRDFITDIEEMIAEQEKIKELSEKQKTSDYSMLQNAYLEFELMSENIIFKYSQQGFI